MGHRAYQNFDVLSAAVATGAGATFRVEDYRNIMLSLATDGGGTADLTVMVQGSIASEEPDFDASQAVDNQWDYIAVVDAESGSAIEGDLGISVSSADDYRLLEVNTNGLKWLTVNVTAYSAGEVTVKSKAFE